MNKILCYIIFLITASFASAQILSQSDTDRLIIAITEDQFIDAIMQHSNLPYDAYNNHGTIYNSTYPAQNTMEFSDFNISQYTLVSGTANQDPHAAASTENKTSICGGQSELINPWNESPGATNVTQTLYTLGCSDTKSQTSTSTTTCGWFNGYVAQIGYTPPAGGINGFAQVNGQINGSNQTQQSCSEGLTYNIAPTPIMVPAGCKAVVMQTLDTVDFSGTYTFSEIIKDGRIKFTTRGSTNTNDLQYGYKGGYSNTGYVDMLDLIKYGTIPQSAMSIESGNLILKGSGTFKASGFGQYSITYYFDEADPAYKRCNPNGNLLATQQTILADTGLTGATITQHREKNGILMYEMKNVPLKTSSAGISCSTGEQSNDNGNSCWKAK